MNNAEKVFIVYIIPLVIYYPSGLKTNDNFVYIAAIRMATSEYSVAYGTTITLECAPSGDFNPKSIYWQRRTKDNAVENILINRSKYNGSTVSSPSLIIHDVDQTDCGIYFCTADSDDETKVIRGDDVSLYVQGLSNIIYTIFY